MARRTSMKQGPITLTALALWIGSLGFDEPSSMPDARGNPAASSDFDRKMKEMLRQVGKELVPKPLTPIPDNPPPHEGAMIEIPTWSNPRISSWSKYLRRAPTQPAVNVSVKAGKLNFTLSTATDAPALTPEQREAILKDFADFWWKSIHPDGAAMDEKTFRDGIIRRLSPPAPADPPK